MNVICQGARATPQQVHDVLLAVMAGAETTAPNQWTATWPDAALPPLRAKAVDGFLHLAVGLPLGEASSWWDLTRANAGLRGLMKFARNAAGAVSLRAEIPIGTENELAIRVSESCEALPQAYPFNRVQEQIGQERNAPSTRPAAQSPPPDLAQLCEAAGWACSSCREGRCTVPLETRRAAYTALVMSEAGRVRVSTELTDWECLSAPVREALSIFLLSANTLLRFVRTAVIEDEAGGAAQLEVHFDTPPSGEELSCAFEALSVGADLCGPEAAVLQQEAAAKLFLAVRGGPRQAARS